MTAADEPPADRSRRAPARRAAAGRRPRARAAPRRVRRGRRRRLGARRARRARRRCRGAARSSIRRRRGSQPALTTAAAVTATMPARAGARAAARVIRVVAADDHPAYLRATTETLTRAGLDVVGISTNGQAALDDVRTHAPDVALVDLRMPGLSGADVARAVRARYPNTRVVILSAYDDREIVQLAVAAGATALRHQGQHARGDRARRLPRGGRASRRCPVSTRYEPRAGTGARSRSARCHLRPPDGGVVAARRPPGSGAGCRAA